MTTPRDFDHDRFYRNPRAWAQVKKALGRQLHLDSLFAALENFSRSGCVRLMLAVAIHDFVSAPHEEKARALTAYFNRCDQLGDGPWPAWMLVNRDGQAPDPDLEREFQAAAKRIMDS